MRIGLHMQFKNFIPTSKYHIIEPGTSIIRCPLEQGLGVQVIDNQLQNLDFRARGKDSRRKKTLLSRRKNILYYEKIFHNSNTLYPHNQKDQDKRLKNK